MDTRPALEDLIPHVKYWHQVRPGHYAPTKSPASPDCVVHTYTVAEFSAIEPKLSKVWVGFNEETDFISGNALRMQIEFWKTPTLWLPPTDRHDVPAAVYRFVYMTWNKDDTQVSVGFEKMVMSKNDRGVFYPCYPEPATRLVPRWWLDDNLPQWEERYSMALTLDLGPAELTQLLRAPTGHQVNPSLPDVLFD